MKHIPPRMRTDPGWRGAMFILQRAFPDYGPDIWRYVDTEKCSIFFEQMIRNRAWSYTEGLLLEAAASLFDPDFKTPLYRLVNRLDDQQIDIVIEAMRVSSGRAQGVL